MSELKQLQEVAPSALDRFRLDGKVALVVGGTQDLLEGNVRAGPAIVVVRVNGVVAPPPPPPKPPVFGLS